ncbi:MAG: hypothetical protein HGA93_07195 [Methanothrix sp.]|nr:hypothetical protein [Methanothrix sp.]
MGNSQRAAATCCPARPHERHLQQSGPSPTGRPGPRSRAPWPARARGDTGTAASVKSPRYLSSSNAAFANLMPGKTSPVYYCKAL